MAPYEALYGEEMQDHPISLRDERGREKISALVKWLTDCTTATLSRVHNVFHVSMLKKFIANPDHVIQFSDFELNNDMTYEERPVKVVDFKEQALRRRTIPYVKVQWSNHSEREATWELELEMRESGGPSILAARAEARLDCRKSLQRVESAKLKPGLMEKATITIEELAIGLEKSDQKFVWVLRDADGGDVFADEQNADKRRRKLPQGYEERLKGVGMVVRDWVPQLEILAHKAIGAFMSHCGWNSCMESLSFGVPILAWPMHSDQPRNAMCVSEYLKVGFMVRDWEHRMEVVSSMVIVEVVKRLMVSDEGMEVKDRARELGEQIRVGVSHGGSSWKEMQSFISYIST
ncbi:zeatin O-xylosyltransferase-like [Dioscorea cayenensis subsp. rotundata]|uniref:Zeatin O-xylosyltransferase-like n=1 Tax=Dioscorea cayennensis subsp. rotundata TaxID=55577 RepID=A0AB40CGD3_DIOCR|nr:zeatin O-xylosyltransferase-like [Dioscorea cayenensis subsp. rotundata]